MKSMLIILSLAASFNLSAFEKDMCESVASYDQDKCEKLVSGNKFEQVPVELCQFRMGSGGMLECFEAIANKTYLYEDILSCAARHRYGIPGCLEEVGSPVQ